MNGVSISISEALSDPAWDAFLESTSLGHFQQSSLWAQVKQVEGWRPVRVTFRAGDRIVGGFQVLHRRTRWGGKIGYVSKGPVVVPEEPEPLDCALEQIKDTVRAQRLLALVLQPPDASQVEAGMLKRRGFLPNHLVDVISATLVVDLAGGPSDLLRRMKSGTRSRVRAAGRKGVVIREGDVRDAGVFFALMSATCVRQQTTPSPSTELGVRKILETFHSRGAVRLTFADCEGEPVAGFLCLRFGDRVTNWKKGWSGKYPERYPNQLLTFESMEWAQRVGARCFDFVGMNREMAEAMLTGKADPTDRSGKLYWYNLGFGAAPQLLTESQVYIANPVLRWLYGIADGKRR